VSSWRDGSTRCALGHDDGAVSLGTSVLTFAVLAAALTVTPGLDTALVLRAALTQNRPQAAATALGIVAGLFVWAAAAAAGVSALLTASELAYDVLRYAGAAYLVWSGGRLLWQALQHRPEEAVPAGAPGSVWRAARLGLLLAGVHGALSLVRFGLLIGLASVLGRWLRRPATVRTIDGVTGAALLGFGARLAFSGR
jgi:threonine/homoserine/homoserine lactone efflux protein